MNSYVNLMLDVEAAKKRLSSALRTVSEADRHRIADLGSRLLAKLSKRFLLRTV
jgi:hypothetical protein